MSGYRAMLRKETREITRTWRIWLLVGAFTFFGTVDPVLARYTPAIIGSVLGPDFPFPDPTHLDAFAQWAKDLTQTLMIVVLALAAGSIASEANSGSLIIPLTRPLTRQAFVLAKGTALLAAVTLAGVLGTLATWGVTALLFGAVDATPLWAAFGTWVLLAALFGAVTVAASSAINSTIGALAIGFGAYIVVSVAALWPPLRENSPAGLPGMVGKLALEQDVALAWPLVTGVVAVVLFAGLAVLIFRRREL